MNRYPVKEDAVSVEVIAAGADTYLALRLSPDLLLAILEDSPSTDAVTITSEPLSAHERALLIGLLRTG